MAHRHSSGSGERANRILASDSGRMQGTAFSSGQNKKPGSLQSPGVSHFVQFTRIQLCQFPLQTFKKWRMCLASAMQCVVSIFITLKAGSHGRPPACNSGFTGYSFFLRFR